MGYAPRQRIVSIEAAAAEAEVVSVADMRLHLRIDASDTSHDGFIADCEASAVNAVEKYTQRLLTKRTVTLSLPGLPFGRCPVELPGGRIASVTSVTIDGEDLADVSATGDAPAVLVPDADWPAVTGEGYPVTIVYEAGYAAGEVPPLLLTAVKLWTEDLFDRPESGSDGISMVLRRAMDLADLYRIRPA
ncbi:hypothetical protein HKCCE4037_06450 [Rhodobacterales bacterium HKCCE4037]|nr:hypothetical protein [Rhodobacterales bacterium HKCCE4037]